MSKNNSNALGTKHKLPLDRYDDVLERAKKGDRSVLPQIRELIDAFPSMVDELGDFTQMAQSAMLNNMDGGSVLTREAEERKLVALTEEISGPNPTTLEKLLADQIVLCWQHVRYIEIKYAQARDYTFKHGEYFQRCMDRAQRRYLNAIKTLAQVCKLQLPTIQLNVAGQGGKQVNIAG